MGNAYSYDLRIRVIEAVDEGQSITKVSKGFKVGRATIYNWLKLRNEQGHLKSKENWQQGHSHKITDLEKFKTFVEENEEKTLVELAEAWGNVKRMTIQRADRKSVVEGKSVSVRVDLGGRSIIKKKKDK